MQALGLFGQDMKTAKGGKCEFLFDKVGNTRFELNFLTNRLIMKSIQKGEIFCCYLTFVYCISENVSYLKQTTKVQHSCYEQ